MSDFFKRNNAGVIASHGSGEAIYNVFCRRFLSSLVWILSSVLLVACDFHGPWEYYPEEREVYTGIYTYGYVLAGGETNVCFSKVYELDEASSQDFAFYDSAYVTVSGLFYDRWKIEKDKYLYNRKKGIVYTVLDENLDESGDFREKKDDSLSKLVDLLGEELIEYR